MREPFQRLQDARLAAGFANATDAARAFGFNENTYRSHENGERGLRPKIASRYAAAFKVTLAWLLTGTGEKSSLRKATLAGIIVDEGIVAGKRASGSYTVTIPFEPPQEAFAYVVESNRLNPRYTQGDALLCWTTVGSFHFPDDDEGIAWTEESTGIVCRRQNADLDKYSAQYIPNFAKQKKPVLGVNAFDPIVVVLRKGMYSLVEDNLARMLLARGDSLPK